MAGPVSAISPTIKDIIQIIAWFSAVGVGVFGVIKGLLEIKKNREERILGRKQAENQLRWSKANLAREIIKELFNESLAFNAMQMFDWSGGNYEISKDEWVGVTHEELKEALRVHNLKFTKKEKYVRDRFDEFIEGLELIEHYLHTELILFEDVSFPLAYYVKKLKQFSEFVYPYLDEYECTLAKKFIDRF